MFDSETNTVFFASCLKDRYPEVFHESVEFLTQNGIDVQTIEGTNLWLRDFMPLPVNGKFLKFRYDGYGGKYPQLRVSPSIYKQFNVKHVDIYLDVGNVQRFGERCIITKRVLIDNPGLKISQLEKILESEIVLIPCEPFCKPAHSDGIVHFINEKKILVNDYGSMLQAYYKRYGERLLKALKGFSIELLVCSYNKAPQMTLKEFRKVFPLGDDFNPAFGCYINFLEVGKVILLPKFEIVEDEIALTKIKQLYPDYKVKQIDCSQLSMEGGCVNCVSANYTK